MWSYWEWGLQSYLYEPATAEDWVREQEQVQGADGSTLSKTWAYISQSNTRQRLEKHDNGLKNMTRAYINQWNTPGTGI